MLSPLLKTRIQEYIENLLQSLSTAHDINDFISEDLILNFDSLKTESKKIQCPFAECNFSTSGAFVFASHMFDKRSSGGHREFFTQEILGNQNVDFSKSTYQRQIARILGLTTSVFYQEIKKAETEKKQRDEKHQKMLSAFEENVNKKLEAKGFQLKKPEVFSQNSTETPFRSLCSKIREETLMKQWKERVWDYYYKKHNNMVPCYICYTSEANQLHHSSLPFHLIILQILRATSMEANNVFSNEKEYIRMLENVIRRHNELKPEDILPTCQSCNMKAEESRKEKSKFKS